jgi:heavy metal translocating P-type ATPase
VTVTVQSISYMSESSRTVTVTFAIRYLGTTLLDQMMAPLVAPKLQKVKFNTVMTSDSPAMMAASALQKVQTGWPRLQAIGTRLRDALQKIEREQAEPLLNEILVRWGDSRRQQRQRLGSLLPTAEPSGAEREINRGVYLSGASLGLAILGSLFYPPLQLLSLPGLAYGTWQLYRRAYHTVVNERRLDINVLMALVNTAYIGGGYWVLGNLTTTSYFFSTKLLLVIKDRLQQDLVHSLAQQPRLVWAVVAGQEVQRRLEELQAGDAVIVYAGETLPVDGVIASGIATIDEHTLTGEAHPVEKTVGDQVYTATLVLTGKLTVTVEQAGTATMVARMAEVLAQTVDFRSTRQLRMETLTDLLVAPTLGLAAFTLPFFGASAAAAVIDSHPFRHLNNYAALGILNTFVAAAEQGILIKDGRSLELLQQVDTLVFDKTGTLTQPQPQVAAIHCVDTIDELRLLSYAAAAEQHQRHPIARAILSTAQTRGVAIPPIDEATFKVGLGLVVSAGGHTIHVGSARFMALEAIALPPTLQSLPTASQQRGHLLVWVARDGEMIGALELEAPLRPEAQSVINTLRQALHLRSVLIVSGDHPVPTAQAAAALSADGWYAEALPADKAALIARLQSEGRKVCFIGDGINDAIALKQAHVSISLAGATLAAIDTAHVILMDESLAQLPTLFALAQRFERTQRLMMAPVLGTSLLCITGVYLWGWGLTAATILDQISLIGGASVIMQPRLAPEQQ